MIKTTSSGAVSCCRFRRPSVSLLAEFPQRHRHPRLQCHRPQHQRRPRLPSGTGSTSSDFSPLFLVHLPLFCDATAAAAALLRRPAAGDWRVLVAAAQLQLQLQLLHVPAVGGRGGRCHDGQQHLTCRQQL